MFWLVRLMIRNLSDAILALHCTSGLRWDYRWGIASDLNCHCWGRYQLRVWYSYRGEVDPRLVKDLNGVSGRHPLVGRRRQFGKGEWNWGRFSGLVGWGEVGVRWFCLFEENLHVHLLWKWAQRILLEFEDDDAEDHVEMQLFFIGYFTIMEFGCKWGSYF